MTHVRNVQPLDAGEPFPEFTWQTVKHGEILLPSAAAGKWSVVLVYRGEW